MSSNTSSGATASQAWAILKRHARDEIGPLRLQELCRDNDRVSSLVTVYNSNDTYMIMVDLSRQRMTLETLNHLLRLARTRDIQSFIQRLAWGPANDPSHLIVPKRIKGKKTTEDEADQGAGRVSITMPAITRRIPSYHLSLRAPKGSEMILEDGTNAVTAIHRDWERIQRISDSLRRGQLPGVTGQMIRDVVVVGRGVPIMALRFVYLALCKDEGATIGRRAGLAGRHQRRLKFVTSVDPIRVAAVVADLDPATTFVWSIALTGQEETTAATRLLKSWLLRSLVQGGNRRPEQVLAKHMMLVTGSVRLAASHKPESVFVIPDHSRCEPFCTFTAATLLPLAIVFGWSIVEKFLQGAHDMDDHFVTTNPRHNVPVLLALADVWNDSFLHSNGRIVTPYTEALAAYPAFCATLESQACGSPQSASKSGASLAACTQVIDGGLHHAYDRSLYQSHHVQPTELVMTLDSQIAANAAGLADLEEIHASQDALLCSMFAHADELAFGSGDGRGGGATSPRNSGLITTSDAFGAFNTTEHISEGDRPSSLLLCGRLDAFACGQLVTLAEHRAVIKARLWDINPFVHETGSTIRTPRLQILQECLQTMFVSPVDDDEEEESVHGPSMTLSTKTILRHYSNLMRDQRVYSVDSSK